VNTPNQVAVLIASIVALTLSSVALAMAITMIVVLTHGRATYNCVQETPTRIACVRTAS
jgi:hypothetical protein